MSCGNKEISLYVPMLDFDHGAYVLRNQALLSCASPSGKTVAYLDRDRALKAMAKWSPSCLKDPTGEADQLGYVLLEIVMNRLDHQQLVTSRGTDSPAKMVYDADRQSYTFASELFDSLGGGVCYKLQVVLVPA